LTPEEVREVETFVNQRVVENLPLTHRVTSMRKALAAGATALFGEKYGDEVRMVEVTGDDEEKPISRELCGGTHCDRTGDVGPFIITGEEAVAAGIRRITAVTGLEAVNHWQQDSDVLHRVAGALETPRERLLERAQEVVEEMKSATRELARRREEEIRRGSTEAAQVAAEVGDTKVVVVQLPEAGTKELRSAADEVRRRFGSVAAALATQSEGQARVLVALSRELVERGVSARKLIASIAEELGGGGGGREDMAQAGGGDASKLEPALKRFVVEAGKALEG
jgi:alanyl-tRNA synthetase